MTDSLSPFVFQKLSLKHLETGQESIVLKYRKATMVDSQKYRAKFGDNFLQEKLQDTLIVAGMTFDFLSRESLKSLSSINFLQFDPEKGEEVPMEGTLKDKYLMLLPGGEDGQKIIYEIFFYIFGYTKKQIDIIHGVVEAESPKKEKKTQNSIQKKKP